VRCAAARCAPTSGHPPSEPSPGTGLPRPSEALWPLLRPPRPQAELAVAPMTPPPTASTAPRATALSLPKSRSPQACSRSSEAPKLGHPLPASSACRRRPPVLVAPPPWAIPTPTKPLYRFVLTPSSFPPTFLTPPASPLARDSQSAWSSQPACCCCCSGHMVLLAVFGGRQ